MPGHHTSTIFQVLTQQECVQRPARTWIESTDPKQKPPTFEMTQLHTMNCWGIGEKQPHSLMLKSRIPSIKWDPVACALKLRLTLNCERQAEAGGYSRYRTTLLGSSWAQATTAFGIWNMLFWLYDYNIPGGKKGGKQQTNYLLLACPETFPKKGRFSDLQVSMTAPLVAPVSEKKKSEFSCRNAYNRLVSA